LNDEPENRTKKICEKNQNSADINKLDRDINWRLASFLMIDGFCCQQFPGASKYLPVFNKMGHYGQTLNRINMKRKYRVSGIGEVLWDQLPQGDVLGGAPANVAYHAGQLGAESYIISAVGNDKLGEEIISRLSTKNINLLINKVAYPTGTVKVTLDDKGVPDFIITKDVAWDHIELTDESSKLASQLDAVCFGSLAQRNKVSHYGITKFLNLVPENALKIFDINLRQNFYNKQLINESLKISNIMKINDDELLIIAKLFGWKGDEEYICRKLLDNYELKLLAYTCGTNGSYLYSADEKSFLKTPVVKVKDTIGAGDSFSAALMVSLLNGNTLKKCHALAVDISAFVCENDGAMPEYTKELRNIISSFSLNSANT
jgi:fructokinase